MIYRMDRIFDFVGLILYVYIHVNLDSPGHSADRQY